VVARASQPEAATKTLRCAGVTLRAFAASALLSMSAESGMVFMA
jgi:hypothetical protein